MAVPWVFRGVDRAAYIRPGAGDRVGDDCGGSCDRCGGGGCGGGGRSGGGSSGGGSSGDGDRCDGEFGGGC